MNLQEELKALKERIAELEEQAKEEQEFPQDGDGYWYADHDGGVLPSTYDNHYMDRYRQLIGNIFRTEQEAQFAVEKLKVEAELRKFSRPFECGRSNYYIFFSVDNDCLGVDFRIYRRTQGVIYFESKEKVQQAIESIGVNRIEKYIFGVED